MSTLNEGTAENLRTQYEAEVTALRKAVAQKLAAGMSEEDLARWVVAERNALKEVYRGLTPAPVLSRIVSRTLGRYGSPVGPSADQLRAKGKSWADIIDSATRPGDHGDAFASGAGPY